MQVVRLCGLVSGEWVGNPYSGKIGFVDHGAL